VLGFQSIKAPHLFRIPEFNLVMVKMDHTFFFRFSPDDQCVISSCFQMHTKRPPTGCRGNDICQGRFGNSLKSSGTRCPRTGENSRHEDKDIILAKGIHTRFKAVIKQFHAKPLTAEVLLSLLHGNFGNEPGSVCKINFKNAIGIAFYFIHIFFAFYIFIFYMFLFLS